MSRCWPGGPAQLLFNAEPLYFIQTPQVVWCGRRGKIWRSTQACPKPHKPRSCQLSEFCWPRLASAQSATTAPPVQERLFP
jgi:hypothetical protein